MAVTYAWRLDSDKYAYILPPYTLVSATTKNGAVYNSTPDNWLNYGFLSNTPLTDYFLRTVATNAENQFGKNNPSGLSNYTTAFNCMVEKIGAAAQTGETWYIQQGQLQASADTINNWTGMQHADLLSADVYYNVDSADCADLRGVGIKGTRYLGSIPGNTTMTEDYLSGNINGHSLDNLSYVAAGTQYTGNTITYSTSGSGITEYTVDIQPGIPGFTDVYGIYMNDNLEDGETVENSTKTPEYMFVIRNGMNGPRGLEGPPVDVTSGLAATLATKTELAALQSIVTGVQSQISTVTVDMQTLTQYYNTISLDNINNLIVMVNNLQRQLSRLEEYLFGFELPEINSDSGGNGDPIPGGGGTGRIQIVPLGLVTGEDGVITNDYTADGNSTDGKIEGWQGTENVKGKVFHLLGYLEDPDEYLKYESGVRQAPTITRLYSLPNIAVSLTGITFGGLDTDNTESANPFPMNVIINGDTKITGGALMNQVITNDIKVINDVQIEGDLNVEHNIGADTVVAERTMYATNGFYEQSADAPEITEIESPTITDMGDFSVDPTQD